jgi:dephospho-CoA kinase
MESIVLGFSGPTASGKSSISKAIAETLGWTRVSFGDYVRNVALEHGLPVTREVLQGIGASLVDAGSHQFCERVLEWSGWKAGSPLIVDGIRHRAVATDLQNLVSPTRFVLVYVDLDEATRTTRLVARGDTDDQSLKLADADSTEIEVASRLITRADLIVDGSLDLQELAEEIIDWAKQICNGN